jgi:hypothetical protein
MSMQQLHGTTIVYRFVGQVANHPRSACTESLMGFICMTCPPHTREAVQQHQTGSHAAGLLFVHQQAGQLDAMQVWVLQQRPQQLSSAGYATLATAAPVSPLTRRAAVQLQARAQEPLTCCRRWWPATRSTGSCPAAGVDKSTAAAAAAAMVPTCNISAHMRVVPCPAVLGTAGPRHWW